MARLARLEHTVSTTPTPSPPTLRTPRLTLRPATVADSAGLAAIANDMRIAQWLLRMPHPYAPADAEKWISTLASAFDGGEEVVFIISGNGAAGAPPAGEVMGAIGLRFTAIHRRAELGYWLGVAYWRGGYATEAAQAVVDYGFERGDLDRIHAEHFDGNDASARVLLKAGMTREGVLRSHTLRFGRRNDGVAYGILRDEWLARRNTPC